MIDHIADDPRLLALYDERNDLPPEKVTLGSSMVARWRCDVRRDIGWEEPVRAVVRRAPQRRCRVCASVGASSARLAREWSSLNGESVFLVPRGSGRVAWWECDEGHRWQARVASRTSRGAGCPQCSGRVPVAGKTDLASRDPEVAAQWDCVLNGSLTPGDVSWRSGRKVWWRCAADADHEPWLASVANRTAGATGCPTCAGTRVSDTNRLTRTDPEVAAQFVRGANASVNVESLSRSSAVPVVWRCHAGHEWEAPVYARTNGESGCPVCARETVVAGVNDVATTHPDVAAEWSPSNPLPPSQVLSGSDRKFLWVCERGHEWSATVLSRAHGGTGCPACVARLKTSAAEDDVARVMGLLAQAPMERGVRIGRLELDVVHRPSRLAVEFNGLYWHSDLDGSSRMRHASKMRAAHEAGLSLVYVWEDDWTYRRDVVVRLLAHRMGHVDRLGEAGVLREPDPALWRKHHARSLEVGTLSHDEAMAFLDANHILGGVRATTHFALFADDGPVAILSAMRRGAGVWGIERYATRGVVRGGFSRLLTAAERDLAARDVIEQWVTFADASLSDGSLYERCGFTFEGMVRPTYSYVVGGRRVHKSNFRRARFRKDPALHYIDGASETALARVNGLRRAWDCGKARWVRQVGER